MIERGEVEMGVTSFFANRERAEVKFGEKWSIEFWYFVFFSTFRQQKKLFYENLFKNLSSKNIILTATWRWPTSPPCWGWQKTSSSSSSPAETWEDFWPFSKASPPPPGWVVASSSSSCPVRCTSSTSASSTSSWRRLTTGTTAGISSYFWVPSLSK